MASIRTRYKKLIVDFRYMGIRCRETTNLTDTPANRKKLEKIIEKIEAEITLGIFNYDDYFPKSDKAKEMMALKDRANCLQSSTPSFAEFAQVWFDEKKIEWRPSYIEKINDFLQRYLIPYFGTKAIHLIE